MRKIFTIIIAAAFFSGASLAQATWTLDPVHSKVLFTVRHLMISKVTGTFRDVSATLTQARSGDFDGSTIDVTVKTASLNTENEMRDNHLRSADFFESEKFPEAKFVATSFKKKQGNIYAVEGLLTIKDVTKKVSFDAELLGTVKGFNGEDRAAFSGELTINRFDYNLRWDNKIADGTAVVGADVKLTIDVVFAKNQV